MLRHGAVALIYPLCLVDHLDQGLEVDRCRQLARFVKLGIGGVHTFFFLSKRPRLKSVEAMKLGSEIVW